MVFRGPNATLTHMPSIRSAGRTSRLSISAATTSTGRRDTIHTQFDVCPVHWYDAGPPPSHLRWPPDTTYHAHLRRIRRPHRTAWTNAKSVYCAAAPSRLALYLSNVVGRIKQSLAVPDQDEATSHIAATDVPATSTSLDVVASMLADVSFRGGRVRLRDYVDADAGTGAEGMRCRPPSR